MKAVRMKVTSRMKAMKVTTDLAPHAATVPNGHSFASPALVEKTKHEKLFSTPLLRFRCPDHDILNNDLLAEMAALRASDAGASKSNRGGWHSSGNLFDNSTACFQSLRTLARSAVLEATRGITTKVDPESLKLKLFGWMNANPPGGFNAPHTHPGAHWSGVYYVSQPAVEDGNSGMIEFLDPRSDLPNWRLLKAATFSAKKKIRPEPGEMILFPSYLVHWVYPNTTEAERVTVAFNATFSSKKKH